MKTPTLILISIISGFISANAENPSKPSEADNTRQNQVDRDATSVTPVDQSNAPEDLKITQAIRQQVMKQDDLSANAKNVKIITTSNEGIFLRGVVETSSEKARIAEIAKAHDGGKPVVNQISVRQ